MAGKTDERARMRVEEAGERAVAEIAATNWSGARVAMEQGASLCAAREVGRRKLPEFAPFELPSLTDSKLSSSLIRGLAIYVLFHTPDKDTWGIAEIDAALPHENRSTIHRYLMTLVRIGYLTQEGVPDRKYRLVRADA